MTRKFLTFTFACVFIVCIVPAIPFVFADSHIETKILGLNPIAMAVGITIIGLSLRIGLGLAKNKKPIDPAQIFQSLIIGFFGSLPIVATGLHNIPTDISDLSLFVMLMSMLATVIGIDAGIKGARNAIQEAKRPPYDA